LHETDSSDQIDDFLDKMIAVVKFRTAVLPTNFRYTAFRYTTGIHTLLSKIPDHFCAPIKLEIWFVTVFFTQSLRYSMKYRSSHVLC